MIDRRKLAAVLVAAAIAALFPSGALATAGGGRVLVADAGQSSATGAYGGQGQQITPITAPSTLPFTGLDLGLLATAAVALVGVGGALRWRLHHREERLGD